MGHELQVMNDSCRFVRLRTTFFSSNLNFLVDTLLDPLREAYGEPIIDILKTGDLPFDQLILYDTTGEGPRWIHVALRLDPTQNRHAIIRR